MAAPMLPSSVESVNESEWDLEEMRRRKEEQEAEAEESDEEQLVSGFLGRCGRKPHFAADLPEDLFSVIWCGEDRGLFAAKPHFYTLPTCCIFTHISRRPYVG